MRQSLFTLFLFLHVLGVMAGIGPSMAFGQIAKVGRKDPSAARAASQITRHVSATLTAPLAALVFVSGLGMIWATGIDPRRQTWLWLSMVLFLATFGYSTLVHRRNVNKLAALAATPERTVDQSTEMDRLRGRVRVAGAILRWATVVILALMIFKP